MNLTLPRGAKCKRCRQQATIPLPSHHANFCPECFIHFFATAVRRAMKKFHWQSKRPLLVAVSGGKDSLAVWSALHDLGYPTKGVHLNLGIDGFSLASEQAVTRFASERGLPWAQYHLKDIVGYTIPQIQQRTRRMICSVCGLLKRQLLNRMTVQEGYEALVMGHNLDDEAGRLLGNIVRHRVDYLEKQYPYLPSIHPRMPARFKPLYRLEASEIRVYCAERNIHPVTDRCAFSRGATSHAFKDALAFLERQMPGTKRDFLFSYVDRRKAPPSMGTIQSCRQCQEPCFGDLCSVCNLLNRLREREFEQEQG